MSGISILGYIGGLIIASSMPLQVYQSYKNGSTSDISWKWLMGYITGISLIFCYAQLENLPPVWGPLCLEISSTIILICLKIKFDIIDHRVYSCDMAIQTDDVAVMADADEIGADLQVNDMESGDCKKYSMIPLAVEIPETLINGSEMKNGYRTLTISEDSDSRV